MRSILTLALVSTSPRRKALIRNLGMPFYIIPPREVEESLVARSKAQAVDIAIENARRKLDSVADNAKDTVFISADTIVYAKGRVFGKPQSEEEASSHLYFLSRNPHWVITGVSLYGSGRRRDFSELTKVYMTPLTHSQIKNYIKEESIMDKAGSFSIEGPAARFIRRIEGCFYNVLGFPVSRIYRELQRYFLCFILFAGTLLSGCAATEYNLATKRQDTIFYSTEQEVSIGNAYAQKVLKEYPQSRDILLTERLRSIGSKIVEVCDRKDIPYTFFLVDFPGRNAFALPGGYVFFSEELMKFCKSDDEVAGVLAHEVGHIAARHSIKRIQGSYGAMALTLASLFSKDPKLIEGVNVALGSLFSAYSIDDEYLADELAVKYMRLAGYNAKACISLFERMLDEEKYASRPRSIDYFKTHPYLRARISRVKKLIGEPVGAFEALLNQN